MNSGSQPPNLNHWTIAAIWVVLLLATTLIFNGVVEDINNPNQQLTVSVNKNGDKEIILKQNRSGHYVAAGMINGHAVNFLVDTGATLVAIPEHISYKLELEKGEGFQTKTANGVSPSYRTKLDSVSIGSIVITNVPGSISPGMKFDEILLGMSFLKHLKMVQQGKTLIISLPIDKNRNQLM